MSIEHYEPNQVSVSDRALAHLAKQAEQHDSKAVVLGVKETGCNGYMYELSYLNENTTPTELDRLTFANGIEIYIKPSNWDLVRGTRIDLVTEGLNTTLKFANPNADGFCGCGESFSISGT